MNSAKKLTNSFEGHWHGVLLINLFKSLGHKREPTQRIVLAVFCSRPNFESRDIGELKDKEESKFVTNK